MREGNNYLIEGTDHNKRTGLLQIMIPPIEAIQTVDVVTSNFDPELGRETGAVTKVILKSSGNTFHGAAYEYLQNNDLDARSFSNPSVPAIHCNYIGGNFGGAFKRNKLFFFGDYLRTMEVEGSATLETIPSPAIGSGTVGEPGAVFHRTASTTQYFSAYSSNYHALQVKLDHRFNTGCSSPLRLVIRRLWVTNWVMMAD